MKNSPSPSLLTMRSSRRFLSGPILRSLAVASGLVLSFAPMRGASGQTWNGGSLTDDNWGSGDNWVGGVAPGVGTGTTINFAGSTRLTPLFNYAAYDQMGSIFFNTGSGAFTLTGSPIKIFSKIENNSSATQTINFSTGLVLNGTTSTEINPVDGDLIIGSPIFLDTPQLQVWGNNGHTVTFNGIIAPGSVSGAGFALNQNSNAVFAAANTYIGDTFVNAGKLVFAAGGSANSSTINILDTTGANNATVELSPLAGGLALSSNFIVRSGSTGAAALNSLATSGTNTLSGSISLGKDLTLFSDAGGNLAATGVISSTGAMGIAKTGAGTLTLSNTNTYTGQTAVNGGTLSFNTTAALGDATSAANNIALSGGGRLAYTGATFDLGANRSIAVGTGGGGISHNSATAATLTVSGNLTGSDALNLSSTLAGGGNFALTGSNSGYTGAITVDSLGTGLSTLTLSNAAAVPAASSITLNYPAASVTNGTLTTLSLAGVALPVGTTLNMTSFLTGGGISQRSQVTSSGAASIEGPITLSGSHITQWNPIAASTLTINGSTTAGGGGFTGTHFIRGVGNGVLNGTINLPAGNVTKTDGGTWTINSTGNNWLATGVSVGTVKLGIANALPTSAIVTLGQNDANAATLDLNGFNQTIAGLVSNPTTVGANTNTKSVTSATAATLTINQAADSTYAGVLGGSLNLVKTGASVLTLANTASTFTGSVTVDGSASILAVPGNAGAAGDPTALGSGSKAINLVNGGTIRLTSNSNPTGTSTKMFTIGTGGGKIDAPTGVTVTLDDNTGATAQLQGSGDLTKVGAGVLQLGYSGQLGANAAGGGFAGYTGNIIVSAGTLQAGNSNGLGSGAGSTTTVLSGGALDFYSSATTYVEDIRIIGTGPAGNGALLNSSTLAETLTGPLTMTGDSSIGATNTGALTINGVVSGPAFSLTKVGTGAGVVTLANPANTYTGLTTISAGTLAGTTIANVGPGNTSFGNVTTPVGGTIAIGGVGAGVLQINAATVSTTDRIIDLAGTTFNGGLASSGAAAVTFTSNLSVSGVGAKQFTLGGTNANDNTFAGIISNGSGTIGLDKSGAGMWILPASAANTYTGQTNITAGVLWVKNAASLGDVAGGTVQSGAASELRLSGGIAVGNEALSITGGGITNFGALRNYADNNSWGGPVTLTGQARINSDSGTLTMSNTITGANLGLVVGGAGNLTLNGALSFGTGILSRGDGTGDLTLNANAAYTGATTINAGRFILGPGGNLTGATAASVASGATLAVAQSASASANTLGGALTLAAGSQFSMADGFTSTLAVTGATTFAGTAASSLTFDIGGVTTAVDRINSTGTALISAAGETIAINTIGATALTTGSYNLITGGASSALATNPFALTTTKVYVGTTPYTLSLTSAATTVNLNVAAFSGLDTAYWTGDVSGLWNVTGANTNWDTTEGGAVDTAAIPTSVTDVYIHATGAGNLTNQLGQDFTINSLNYTAASSATTVGAGNTLTLAAAGAGNIGINVASGAAAQDFNANLIAAQNQTWINSSANTFTIGGAVSGPGSITKTGTGAVALTNAFNGHTGGLIVNGGRVNLSGTYNTAGGLVSLGNSATGSGLISIAGGNLTSNKITAPSATVGNVAGGVGAINMSSGSLTTASELWVGTAAGGYGAYTQSGGLANVGSWLALGRGGNAAMNLSGGTLNVLLNNITMGTVGGGNGNTVEVANFGGTSTTNVFNGGLLLPEQQSGHVAVANLSGTASLFLGTGVSFGSGGAQVNTGILNLNGGTLATKSILKGTGIGTYLVNLNGGTIKAQPGATAGFMTGLTGAYVNSGGVTIDTNGQNITVGQALLAPTGNGVSATGLTIGGTNSGYIDTPVVTVSGGGGVGATAVADIDYSTGVVTGITITNPGVGYTSAPSFTLTGGGGAATVGGTAGLVANTSGGLVKNGAGILDLTGANTYTGATVVNGGGITIGNTYATSGFTFGANTSFGLTNAAALTVPQNFALTTALTKAGAGVATLTGTNSFAGASISAGLLQLSSAAALTVPGRTVVASGGAVSYDYSTPLQPLLYCQIDGISTGSLGLSPSNDATQNLDFSAASGANQTGLSLGAQTGSSISYTGTLTPNGTTYRLGGGGGSLTLPNTNALTGARSLVFNAPAGGDVVLTGTNDFTGGTSLSGGSGTYNLIFSNGSLGSGPIAFSASSTLRWAAGNTQDISASGRVVTVGSGGGFLDTNGNNVVLGSPIGNFGPGALTKAGAGNLTLTGINTYTGQTNITGGTLILANGARLSGNVNLSVANTLVTTASGTATIGGLQGNFANALAGNSTLILGANNSSLSYPNVLSGSGAGVTKIGAGTQTFTGANTYTGATTINMGNLTSGQLVSSVLNLSYAAQTNRVAATSALVLGGSTATDAQTILGGGTLQITNTASTSSQVFAGTTVGVGNNVIFGPQTNTAFALTLGAVTRNPGGTLQIIQPSGTLSATNGVLTTSGTSGAILTSAAGTAYAIVGATSPTTLGAYGWAGKNAGGWLDAASVTYTTSTSAATFSGNANVTGSFTATAPTTVNSIRMNAATGLTLTNGGITTVSTGGVLFGSAVNQIITGGTLKPGANNELVFINTNAGAANAGTPQINSVLADGSGPSSVTYRALIGATAQGQFAVGGTNLYTGPTYITSGRVSTGAVAQPFGTGAGAKVYIDGNTNGAWYATGAATVANPFFITGNGWSETASAGAPLGAIRMDSGITLSGGVTVLGDAAIGVFSGTGTVSGAVAGSFNLIKVAGGTLALSGTNTLSGKYVAQAGTLSFNSAGAYGSATGLSLTGGTVTLGGTQTGLQANLINRLTPLNAATALNGTIGISALTAAENVDFTSATTDMSNVYLGASAASLTYTGTITPYNNAYRIGGGGNGMTFSGTDAFTDNNGSTPRSLNVRNNTVTIAGTNNYSGGTNLLSGGITFSNGSLGSGPVTVSGGTLTWAAGNTQDISSGRTLTHGGAATYDIGSNNVTLAGPIAFANAGAFTKAGAGTLTLSAASTATAGTPAVTNNAAGLTLGAANVLTPYTILTNALTAGVITTFGADQTVGGLNGTGTNGAATFALGGNKLTYGYGASNQGVDSVFTGSGASLIKVGTSTQFFRAKSTAYTGGLEVNNGYQVLEAAQITGGANDILPATTTLTLSGGTLDFLGHTAASNTQTFTSPVVLNSGQSAIGAMPRAGFTAGVVTSTFTRNTGSTLNIRPLGGGSTFVGAGTTGGSVVTNQLNADYGATGGNQSILGGWAGFSAATGVVNVVNTPTTWAVSANTGSAISISGLATFSSTFAAGTNVDASTGNTSTGAAALAINSLRFNGAGSATVDAANGLTVASGGILATATVAANPVSILNGTLTSGNGADLIVHQYTTGDFTIGSKITGSIGLTKSGAGRLVLTNAANDYNGTTYVNTGNLRYAVSTTPASSSALVHSGGTIELIDGVTVTGQTANISGAGVGTNGAIIGATGTSTWAGNVVLGDIESRIGAANVATINVTGVISDGAASNGVLNNKLWLSGATGTGTMVLSGANTYTGTTALIRGYLKLGAANALPSTTVLDVHSGGPNFGATADQATVDLNGFSATVAGLARTDTTGAGTITNNAAAAVTLTVNNATASTFSGNITNGLGTVGLTKSGNGALNLSGSNGFSGGLTINGGSVVMGSVNAIGNQAQPNALTMTGGTLDAAGIAEINVSALNGTAGTITDTGLTAGTTTLNSYNTAAASFAGAINDGTVRSLSYVKSGSGVQALTNTGSTYSGVTVIHGGTINVAALANVNTASSIGKGSAAGSAADLLLMGGTLQYTGSTAQSTDRLFSMTNAGGTIDASGSVPAATVALTGTGTVGGGGTAGARTLTLTGSNTGANTLASIVADNAAAATSLGKTGTGSWSVSGASTLTGTTSVTGGQLEIAGAGSLAATSAVSVSGGTLLLSSSASNRVNDSAPVTLGGASTASTLAVSGAVTETLGALTLSSGSGVRVIDMGTGAGLLTFASLASSAPGVAVEVWNWSGTFFTGGGTDRLISTGVLGANLSLDDIKIYGDSGTTFLGTTIFAGGGTSGELVPIPEAGSVLTALLLLGSAGWRERRKLMRVR